MTCPSNVQKHMNDYFTYQHTCRVLQEENQKLQNRLKKTSSDSDSSDESDSEKSISVSQTLRSEEYQKKAIINTSYEGAYLLYNNTKENSLSLRISHVFSACCCIQ